MKNKKTGILLYLLFVAAIIYLVANTGLVSDDLDAMARAKSVPGFFDLLIPHGVFYFIETPLEYYTHYIWYYFFNINGSTAAEAFKIAYIVLSFYLVSKFFGIFLDRRYSLLAAFLFIFFPSHDATAYCFMLQYLTLSIALYLYAFYLAHRQRLIQAFLVALAASFISYGSTATALALFGLFCLQRQYRKGLVLLIPNMIYAAYYMLLSKAAGIGTDKISAGVDIVALAKQFIFQAATFVDACVGPSMWLKIYYAFTQLQAVSFAAAALVAVIFYFIYSERPGKYDRRLLAGLTLLLIISLGMFAVTGRYPQLAFNLGNRVTIFGSLLLAYLLTLVPAGRKGRALLFGVMIFAIFGISDHWKESEIHRQKIFANIRNNRALQIYRKDKAIGISGNQYSVYGPLGHIEFLSEGFVTTSVFDLLVRPGIKTIPLNRNFTYEEGYIVDLRDNSKTKASGGIYVYDSEKDTMFSLEPDRINGYIGSLPLNNRHWIQLIDAPRFRDILARYLPRLKKYL